MLLSGSSQICNQTVQHPHPAIHPAVVSWELLSKMFIRILFESESLWRRRIEMVSDQLNSLRSFVINSMICDLFVFCFFCFFLPWILHIIVFYCSYIFFGHLFLLFWRFVLRLLPLCLVFDCFLIINKRRVQKNILDFV